MDAELRSQPETWARAAGLRDEQALLPASGLRVAVVGCGTSWFMAQSYAALRETSSHRVTDAFAASPLDGMADLVRAQRVALVRARRLELDPDHPRNLTRSVILAS